MLSKKEEYTILFSRSKSLTEYILSDFINKALEEAIYEKLEDGSYAGRIPDCLGVVAFGKTLRECEAELH